MANNYQQWSVIVAQNLRDEERAWLDKVLSEPEEGEKGGKLGPNMELDGPLEGLFWVEDYGRVPFTAEYGDGRLWCYEEDGGDLEVFADFAQFFLHTFRPKESVGVSWADTCSKMRADNFGGGAMYITAETQEWISTYDWLKERSEEHEKTK